MKKTTKKPGMPFADSAIAKYIDKKIDELKGVKTQREIAAEIGYEMPNIISMFKRGESRVPLDKIPLLVEGFGRRPGSYVSNSPSNNTGRIGATSSRNCSVNSHPRMRRRSF